MISKHFRVLVLILLLVVSGFAVFTFSTTGAFGVSITNNSIFPNSDTGSLTQYEWPQFTGDASSTRFSAGPAPEAPDVLWKTTIPGVLGYITAFNGMVFATSATQVFALDRETGAIIWTTGVPSMGRWPAVFEIDDTHMVVGSSCLDPKTGSLLWTSASFSVNVALFASAVYSPEEHMFFCKSGSYVQAWDFSIPSVPPALAWSTYVPGGENTGSGVQYGDGKVFPGSFLSRQMVLDAKTGQVLWDTPTKGSMLFAGSYYDGKFLKASPYDDTFYCFDANSGKVLWTFNPGTSDGYWCSGSAAAYGIVYELNKDGHLYALDIDTGKLVWNYMGPGPLFFPGNPVIADGKIYANTGQQSAVFPDTGQHSTSEFACIDAYTGQVIWKLPVEDCAPRDSAAIAYGNLYFIPGYIQYEAMENYTTLDQVWGLGTSSWSMWRNNPAHTGVGQSGPTDLNLRWNFTTAGSVVSSPSIAYGRVYVGSEDKKLYCLDAHSGSLLWAFNTGDYILSSPAAANGKVYVGPDDGTVYCLDAYNGSLIWSRFAGGDVKANYNAMVILHSSPTAVGGMVYVGALDNKTYCLDANTGNIDWTFSTQGYITSSPAVNNGVVYVESQEPAAGAVYALKATTGDLIWKTTFPYELASRGTDLMSSPSIGNNMIFIGSNRQAYYGIDAATGNITWTYRDANATENIICSAVYNEGKVYLIDEFFIVCVDAPSGHPLWRSFLGSELYVSPTYADGNLYVTADERALYVVNATDGKTLSYLATDSNSWSAPSLYEGRLYVGSNDWNVYCFSQYLPLNSSLTVELAESRAVLGESVSGSGQLTPGLVNERITLSFADPDGTVNSVDVVTQEKGSFNFTYKPVAIGNYSITAQWQPTVGYYSLTNSKGSTLEVTVAPVTPSPPPTNSPSPKVTPYTTQSPFSGPFGLPLSYFYAAVAFLAVVVIAASVIFYWKQVRK